MTLETDSPYVTSTPNWSPKGPRDFLRREDSDIPVLSTLLPPQLEGRGTHRGSQGENPGVFPRTRVRLPDSDTYRGGKDSTLFQQVVFLFVSDQVRISANKTFVSTR